MNCVDCGKQMNVVEEKETYNSKTGDKYDYELLHCVDCDLWMTIERPKKDS